MYEDKTLVCKECGKEFVFTAGEQEFYAERGFQKLQRVLCQDERAAGLIYKLTDWGGHSPQSFFYGEKTWKLQKIPSSAM